MALQNCIRRREKQVSGRWRRLENIWTWLELSSFAVVGCHRPARAVQVEDVGGENTLQENTIYFSRFSFSHLHSISPISSHVNWRSRTYSPSFGHWLLAPHTKNGDQRPFWSIDKCPPFYPIPFLSAPPQTCTQFASVMSPRLLKMATQNYLFRFRWDNNLRLARAIYWISFRLSFRFRLWSLSSHQFLSEYSCDESGIIRRRKRVADCYQQREIYRSELTKIGKFVLSFVILPKKIKRNWISLLEIIINRKFKTLSSSCPTSIYSFCGIWASLLVSR